MFKSNIRSTSLLLFTLLFTSIALSACSSSNDGNDDTMVIGETDSGETDSGETDSGETDSGETDPGETDPGEPEPVVLNSCEAVDIALLPNTGGVFNTRLPADLSIAGSQIVFSDNTLDQFTAFDASTGLVQFTPSASRLSNVIEYDVMDAGDNVLASHSHRWVYSPVRVMPMGDSITAGVEFFDGSIDLPVKSDRVGYRQFLFDQLTDDGFLIDYRGQGGQAAGAGAGLIDPDNNGYPGVDIDFINSKVVEVLTEHAVDIILLHIGTNNTPADAQGIDAILDTLDEWEAANQPVIAMVATIVPKRDAALNAEVMQFNEDLIARIAARTNDRIVLVDQNAAVAISDLSTEQIGIHPSAAGYEKMAAAWYDALVDSASDALYNCAN